MIYLINGSPRRHGNTAVLLQHAQKGAREAGADTELIDLYSMAFKGCISCFACKLKNGKFHGMCAQNDPLKPVLEKLRHADAVIMGSPIYFYNISSGMQAFLERFLFPYDTYGREQPTSYPKSIPTGCIYTMNMTEQAMQRAHIDENLKAGQFFIEEILGQTPQILYSYNTYQFPDYSKYDSSKFSEPDKAKWKAEVFPLDCTRAYELGKRIAEQASIE